MPPSKIYIITASNCYLYTRFSLQLNPKRNLHSTVHHSLKIIHLAPYSKHFGQYPAHHRMQYSTECSTAQHIASAAQSTAQINSAQLCITRSTYPTTTSTISRIDWIRDFLSLPHYGLGSYRIFISSFMALTWSSVNLKLFSSSYLTSAKHS